MARDSTFRIHDDSDSDSETVYSMSDSESEEENPFGVCQWRSQSGHF